MESYINQKLEEEKLKWNSNAMAAADGSSSARRDGANGGSAAKAGAIGGDDVDHETLYSIPDHLKAGATSETFENDSIPFLQR